MDTVRALNVYRKSIANDASAFEVLCLLYSGHRATEDDLKSWTGIERFKLKQTLRELYQADFLRAGVENSFTLTPFAEYLLSQMGVDRIVISLLVKQIASLAESDKFERFTEWSLRIDPEGTQSTLHSLRNLHVFLSSNDLSESERHSLLWMCALHPDSRTRNSFAK